MASKSNGINHELVDALRSKANSYHRSTDHWRKIAYHSAADEIEKINYAIRNNEDVRHIKKVGPSIALFIENFLDN